MAGRGWTGVYAPGPGLMVLGLGRGLLDLLLIPLGLHADSPVSSPRRPARLSWNRTDAGVVARSSGPRDSRMHLHRTSKRMSLRLASTRTAGTKRRRSIRRWPSCTTEAKTRSASVSRSTRAQSRHNFTKLQLSIVSWPTPQYCSNAGRRPSATLATTFSDDEGLSGSTRRMARALLERMLVFVSRTLR